jgi:hypothetical protein
LLWVVIKSNEYNWPALWFTSSMKPMVDGHYISSCLSDRRAICNLETKHDIHWFRDIVQKKKKKKIQIHTFNLPFEWHFHCAEVWKKKNVTSFSVVIVTIGHSVVRLYRQLWTHSDYEVTNFNLLSRPNSHLKRNLRTIGCLVNQRP